MMVYETADDVWAVDCGVHFPGEREPGVRWIIPSLDYLLQPERRKKFRGYVLTHGHEDHLGALPYILPELPAPVWGTPFTLAILAAKLPEHGVEADMRPLVDNQPTTIGTSIRFVPLPITHSIPGALLLLFDTPIGRVVHTGDFKIDKEPLDGRLTNGAAIDAAGDEGIALLLSDSTNAERSGHTWSEAVVAKHLRQRIAGCPNRVLVTTFSSNLFRLKAVIEAAEACSRKVLPVGRSMGLFLGIGIEQGLFRPQPGTIVERESFPDWPRDQLLVLAAGCQGEPRSAFGRISRGQDKYIQLTSGDTAFLSSRRIPGNEAAVSGAMNGLLRTGVEVVDDREPHLHTSGHAYAEEQRQMLRWCRPEHFVPMHGEFRQLSAHAAMGAEIGALTHVVEDGMGLEFTRPAAVNGQVQPLQLETLEKLPPTSRYLDGSDYINDIVLRDRQHLRDGGFVACTVQVDADGQVVDYPVLISRGVVFMDDSAELMGWAEREVANAVEKCFAGGGTDEQLSEAGRVALRRFFRKELQRRPVIVCVVRAAR